jgi:hypothetical protein
MKAIKLDYRHTLKRWGYDYAFMFRPRDSKTWAVEEAVRKLEGYGWLSNHTFYGKTKNGVRPYYVGFKKESTATMVMLMTSGN